MDVGPDMENEPATSRSQTLMLVLLIEGGAGVMAIALGWLFGQKPTGHLAWNLKDFAIGVAATGPLLVMFSIVYGLRNYGPFHEVDDIFREYLFPALSPCSTVDLVFISALAGVGEELLFRGTLQSLLIRWTGETTGLGLASALFALAHFVTVWYAIITGLAGLYLGWLYLATDNLLTAIVAHAVYDAVALIFVLKIRPPQLTVKEELELPE